MLYSNLYTHVSLMVKQSGELTGIVRLPCIVLTAASASAWLENLRNAQPASAAPSITVIIRRSKCRSAWGDDRA